MAPLCKWFIHFFPPTSSNLFYKFDNAEEATCCFSGERISVAWLMALRLNTFSQTVKAATKTRLTAKTHMIICCVLNKILYPS